LLLYTKQESRGRCSVLNKIGNKKLLGRLGGKGKKSETRKKVSIEQFPPVEKGERVGEGGKPKTLRKDGQVW